MIVGASLPYQSPVTSTRRNDDVVKDKSDTTDKPADTTAAQFAAMMALLGGANSKVRTELLKQVPATDSSLLDKLLAGAQGSETGATSAADAARYGMLLGNSTTDVNALAAGIQGASSSATGVSRISADVLARIASRKSGSVETLLALGDKDAAAAKAKLDALLSTAGTSTAAALAAANALATALAASAANPTTPITSTDGLDPEFRAKLEAVMARMKNETGSTVSIVETVRSQDRQDALFAQGRTTSGDVVTWTQDSAHKQGKAADVIVDGSWNNPKGFALLQQIAKEEGLKTLGAADPGHLELASDGTASAKLARANAQSAQANGIARVANVASVASVASMGATVTSVKSTPAATTNNAPVGLMAQATKTSSDARATSQDSSSDKSSRDKSAESAVASPSDSVLGELGRNSAHKFVGPVDSVDQSTPASGVDGAARVARIDDLQSQSPAGPVSQMTLEVDGINGDKQQITVDMRGNTVGTNITTDAASATRMRANVGDLQSSLENHGLQVDTVRISTPRATEATDGVKQASSGDALRMGGAASTNTGDGSFQQGQRERSTATRDWEDRQAQREEQRPER